MSVYLTNILSRLTVAVAHSQPMRVSRGFARKSASRKDRGKYFRPPASDGGKIHHLADTRHGLTPENRLFLSDLAAETYAPAVQGQSSPLLNAPWARGQWADHPRPVRCGLIGLKIGMVPQWLGNGRRIETTMIQVLDNHVIDYIPPDEYAQSRYYNHNRMDPGYAAVVVGALGRDPHMYDDAYLKKFEKCGLPPKKKLSTFHVTPNAALQPGTPLYAGHFRPGMIVDVWGRTIDHGFQGAVKRHGFSVGKATHGNTKTHRRTGFIGAGRHAAKVWKGKAMPGHMGNRHRRAGGLRILRIDNDLGVIYVLGNVPGHNHSLVTIVDNVTWDYFCSVDPENPPPFPTFYPDEEILEDEMFNEGLFHFDSPSIVYAPDPITKGKAKR